MNTSGSPLLISLRPFYADLIFQGVKKVELRRGDLRRMEGRDVYVYVTSPVMVLRGGFNVGEVFTGTPQEIWDEVSTDGALDRTDFDAYYAGQKLACALKITKVWEYDNPRGLDWLREQFTGFVVPQSWRYVKPDEHEAFRGIKRLGEKGEGNAAAPAEARLMEPLFTVSVSRAAGGLA